MIGPPTEKSRPSRASGAAPQTVRRAGADGSQGTGEYRQDDDTLFNTDVRRGAYGTTVTYSTPDERAAKDAALAEVDRNTDNWWRDCCDRGIAELARRGVVFQSTDLVHLGVPEPDHPNRWGARLHVAAKRGVIEPAGFGPSKRPTTRSSIVRLWRGAPR